MADLTSIAHDLYGLPLGEFTPARNAKAKQATDAGDIELSKKVRILRKPSVAAWAVNMLARYKADLVQEVLHLGAELRQAQSASDGPQLRTLDTQRRELMKRIEAESAAVAEAHGQKLGASARPGVEDTVRAALADPEAAGAMQSGVLTETLSAPGLGAVDLADVLALPVKSTSPTRRKSAKSSTSEQRAADRARERLADARSTVDDAERSADEAAQESLESRMEVEEVDESRVQLKDELHELDQRSKAAHRELERRDRAEATAKRTLDKAQQRLDQVRRANAPKRP